MAAALPIAAFDTPVHREYLGDLGYYAPPGDAAALAEAISRALAADPAETSRRGWVLRARVVKRYTWQHAASEIEDRHRTVIE